MFKLKARKSSDNSNVGFFTHHGDHSIVDTAPDCSVNLTYVAPHNNNFEKLSSMYNFKIMLMTSD